MSTLRNYLEKHGFKRAYLQKLSTGHYKLDLYINGVHGTFILDSGASSSCIGVDARDKFRLESHESDVTATGAGATGMKASLSSGATLSISDRGYRKVVFVLFDLSHVNNALDSVGEHKVDGILGADLLKRIRAIIDYGRNALYFK